MNLNKEPTRWQAKRKKARAIVIRNNKFPELVAKYKAEIQAEAIAAKILRENLAFNMERLQLNEEKHEEREYERKQMRQEEQQLRQEYKRALWIAKANTLDKRRQMGVARLLRNEWKQDARNYYKS